MLPQSDGTLAFTYVDNSARPADLIDRSREGTLYWPHFGKLFLLEAVE